MSMMEELKFFLGLQIKQCKDVIFINQTKCARDILNKFGMDGVKSSKTLMSTTTKLNKDENPIFALLDLKSKKEFEFTHHTHLKFSLY